MRRHDFRLLGPAAVAWAAALLATGSEEIGLPPWSAAVAAWTIASAALVVLLRIGRRAPGDGGARIGTRRTTGALGRAVAATLVAAAAAALVSTTATIVIAHRHPTELAAAADQRASIGVVLRLDAAPRPARTAPWVQEPALRAPATVLAVGDPPRSTGPVSVRVDVTMPATAAAAGFGSTLVVLGTPSETDDTRRAAYRLDVARILSSGPAPPYLAWTHPLRRALATASSGLGGDGGALVPGLAIGDTSRVSDDLRAAMTTASLTHLTAVSGANCALVTAGAFWVAGLVGLGRAGRVVVALTALGGFAALVTPEASVVRASAMAIVVLVACATARGGGGVPALSVAVIGLLALDPWYARDAGFALSACATAGLVLWSAPLGALLARWMPRPLAVVVAIPLAAQLACQPVLVLLEPVIPVYGVPANLLAAPAAPIATVAGLAGCLLLPVLPSVGVAALQVAWVPATWIALLARAVERMPVPSLAWPPGAPGAAVMALGIAAGAVLVGDARRVSALGRPRPRAARLVRVSAAIALCLCTAVPLGAAAGPAAIAAAGRPAGWDLWQCDVGQGDAVLVRSGEAVMLVDAGPDPDALLRCLRQAGVDRLDVAVLTHWDADHVGGATALAGRVDVVLHGPLDGARSDRPLAPLVAAGARHAEVVAGWHGRLGPARWRIAWPREGAVPGNDASVVVDLTTPEYRAVFLGDLGREAQDAMMRTGGLAEADVVKVAHHGSADQSASLYRRLDASVGLIGVGDGNGYGHPTSATLDALDEAGTAAVRSDRAGAAALTIDGERIALWTERASGVAGAQ
ncbi:ComEC/Rec2 family competence protein [Agromyces sp. SYSU T0242]|uniref:ComEC/Rec2 family competence protein n=1 Tax=Agromyces litoreus TaxID=3158561 RepID=UPI0033915894